MNICPIRPEELAISPLTETDARNICRWHYPPPYNVYDYPDWELMCQKGFDLTDAQKRDEEYIAFRYMNGLVAFGRIFSTERYVLLGIGLRPDFCGKGLGKAVMLHLIALAAQRFPHLIPALEVRTFNQRAIRCYEACGFKRIKRYYRNTLYGEDQFYFMVLKG